MQKIFSFLLVFILFSCQNKKGSREIDQLVWLVGNWETIAPQGQLYENWTQSNDTILKGSSHMVINDDTVFTESLSIEQRNDGLYYIPSVSNQNAGKPVLFRFIENNNGEIIFENKEHDFPQRIIYKHPHPDTLYARIEGLDNKEYRKEVFFMLRKKNK